MAVDTEPTRSEMLRDPLVRQVMQADGVTSEELARLMARIALRLQTATERGRRRSRAHAAKAQRNEPKHSRNLPAT